MEVLIGALIYLMIAVAVFFLLIVFGPDPNGEPEWVFVTCFIAIIWPVGVPLLVLCLFLMGLYEGALSFRAFIKRGKV